VIGFQGQIVFNPKHTARVAMCFFLWSCAILPAPADEGMWPSDALPAGQGGLEDRILNAPAWIEHVRLATVRLSSCTASFVSSTGLMLTNQHCIEGCLNELSTARDNLFQNGFISGDESKEPRCRRQVADVLLGVEDITAAVLEAAQGLTGQEAELARTGVIDELEKACVSKENYPYHVPLAERLCTVADRYEGAQYFLYSYRRYEDVRLVFAPERAIAAFGGDPDNFQFPRWSLDFAFLRAYENNRPAKVAAYLPIRFAGPQPDERLVVSGHPRNTSRRHTKAQLEFERDVILPMSVTLLSELRGRYIEFGRISQANSRLVQQPLDALENSLKGRRFREDALHNDHLMIRKGLEETRLRAALPAGVDPWKQVESATLVARRLYPAYQFVENAIGFNSRLFRYARDLVRVVEEQERPAEERLPEYTGDSADRVRRDLATQSPVNEPLELLTLSFSLERMREWLGPDHPVVRKLFSTSSPSAIAARALTQTTLSSATARQRLLAGGMAAIRSSTDPMIRLARSVDDYSRSIRKQYEEEVESRTAEALRSITRIEFAAVGAESYPDADFTLRFGYGTLKGWTENGAVIPPVSRLQALFTRSTGVPPYRIPMSWQSASARLDMNTPFCFSTDHDIIGGNSGSPLLDSAGRIVGLVFDGNVHSVAGDYWFDEDQNRAIALHPAIMLVALAKVYRQSVLMGELDASQPKEPTVASDR
jgi:hypothetical protein